MLAKAALVVLALPSLPGMARAAWQVNGVKVLDAGGGGIVTDGAGGAFIAGTNGIFRDDCGGGVSFGRVDDDGNVLVGGGHGVILQCELNPRLMVNGDVAIVMWTDRRLTAPGSGICAQRLNPDGVTPAFLSRVAADVESGHVRLRWLAADPALHGTVYRRTDGETWAALASVVPDARGLLDFKDDAVLPGARYGYRLEDPDGRVLDEVWLDVPPAAALEFRLSSNPSTAGIVAEFSLAEPGAARISLFDVAGRKRADLWLGPLGAGSHASVVTQSGTLEPGIYVVRFAAGGREIVRRVVVTR
jgi:hypothetical protein